MCHQSIVHYSCLIFQSMYKYWQCVLTYLTSPIYWYQDQSSWLFTRLSTWWNPYQEGVFSDISRLADCLCFSRRVHTLRLWETVPCFTGVFSRWYMLQCQFFVLKICDSQGEQRTYQWALTSFVSIPSQMFCPIIKSLRLFFILEYMVWYIFMNAIL